MSNLRDAIYHYQRALRIAKAAGNVEAVKNLERIIASLKAQHNESRLGRPR